MSGSNPLSGSRPVSSTSPGQPPPASPGQRLGKYELQGEIGRGGMGSVYRGYDPLLERWVAVKVLAPHLVWEQGFVERFLREARAAGRLRHTGIVGVYDVGQEGGWYYFVMEYLEGQTLTELVRKRGPLPLEEALRVLRPLAEALDYAHGKGLVHRDVKPGNVIVNPDDGQVTLTDFGIARAAEGAKLTATGAIVGTPEYMSPEQARGESLGPRSDQYSLGVVAYELLSGCVPFQAESTLALLHKIVYEAPPPLRQARPDLPSEVERVLGRVLSKEPSQRYASCAEFVGGLEQAMLGRAVGVMHNVPPPAVRVQAPSTPAPAAWPRSTPAPSPATRVRPKAASGPRHTPAGVRRSPSVPSQPARRLVPVWLWAVLGGSAVMALAVLALGLALALGGGGRVLTTPTPQPAETAVATALPAVLQDTDTPPPSPTSTQGATATHTATPAPTRTATATPLPTETPTEMPTATSTPRPRPTSTPTPIPASPTATPLPALPTTPPEQPTQPPAPPPEATNPPPPPA